MKTLGQGRKVGLPAAITLTILAILTLCQKSYGATSDYFFIPKVISGGVPPNLVLTLDTSKSMFDGFIPKSLDGNEDIHRAFAVKSHIFNGLYYDPEVVYSPPLDVNGDSFPDANFTQAAVLPHLPAQYVNTLYTGALSRWNNIDLSSNYTHWWRFWETKTPDPVSTVCADLPNMREKIKHRCPSPAHYFEYEPNSENCIQSSTDIVPPDACFRLVIIGSAEDRFNGTTEEKRQNFANWYTYYSIKLVAAQTVISQVFTESTFPSSIRFAKQPLNPSLTPSSGPVNSPSEFVAPFSLSERQYFYEWLFAQGSTQFQLYGFTPLRKKMHQAGLFFSEEKNVRERPFDPVNATTNRAYNCRANYNLTVTDGAWNDTPPSSSAIKRDEQPNVPYPEDINGDQLPDHYSPTKLTKSFFKYDQSDTSATQLTLSDIAHHYWITDLLPGVPNEVKPVMVNITGDVNSDNLDPSNNPATWQHMVNLVISFGLSGHLEPTRETVNQLMSDNQIRWPNITPDPSPGQTGIGENQVMLDQTLQSKIDDLFHATLNSRGQYYQAKSTSELKNSLQNAIEAISSGVRSNTEVSINTGTISSGAGVYQAKYDAENGIGNLLARRVSDGRGGDDACNNRPIGQVCDPVWRAEEVNRNANPDNRNIYTFKHSNTNGNPAAGDMLAFNWGSLTGEHKSTIRDKLSALNLNHAATNQQDVVAYIRGEDINTYRQRHPSLLGPIVNSDPLYVGNGIKANGEQERFFPDSLERTNAGVDKPYNQFVCSTPSYAGQGTNGNTLACQNNASQTVNSSIINRKPVVYVNSNDGMMHAYDARLDSADGGKELFAYLPNLLLGNAVETVSQSYIVKPSADGPITSADVFYDNDWHTVLIGGLRTGGKGYYALDVTNPSLFTGDTPPADLALWEFTHSELGFSYSDAIIVKSNASASSSPLNSESSQTGRWVAIFGNGYDSSSNQAGLFIVDVQTGQLIKYIPTGVGSDQSKNGLTTPAVVFNDLPTAQGDNRGYTADYVYAGDLQGNLWKFDLRSSNPDDWEIAGGHVTPQPLFTVPSANGRSVAITSAPIVSAHASGRSGNMIYFGTGRYLFKGTHDDHAIGIANSGTFYGIWDEDLCGAANNLTDCAQAPHGSVPNLYHQTINQASLIEQTITVSSDANRGHRVTTNQPIDWSNGDKGWYMHLSGPPGERVISQPIVSGLNVYFVTFVPEENPCDGGGYSWLMALNRANGGTPLLQPFDHNNDGVINRDDQVAVNGDSTSTSGIKLSSPSAGLQSIARCGTNLCVYATGEPEISQDGLFSGRWRWKQLR